MYYFVASSIFIFGIISGRYVDYNLLWVIYNDDTQYVGLVDVLAAQLGIDTTFNELDIRYFVSDKSPPLSIYNDMSVRVYLDQRRVNADKNIIFYKKNDILYRYGIWLQN